MKAYLHDSESKDIIIFLKCLRNALMKKLREENETFKTFCVKLLSLINVLYVYEMRF